MGKPPSISSRVLLASLALLWSSTPSAAETLNLLAAASTTEAMREVVDTFAQEHDVEVRLSVAASSTLARQIEAGAPADLYLSANVEWMDYLEERKLVVAGSRRDLLANSLVLIAPKLDAAPAPLSQLKDLPAWLGDGRLVIGDPAHVPAGIYAKAALVALGIWPAVQDRAVYTASVRDALSFVARGEVRAGMTYATDARISDKVMIIADVPRDLHAPVRYPVALITGRDNPAARDLIAFLQTETAARIFTAHGFTVLTATDERS